jgi:hypothetical protein
MKITFHTESELSQRLGISRVDFHRKIKPLIVRDFKDELKLLKVDNPDIGLDEKAQIVLAHPANHLIAIHTGLSIYDYL